MHCLGADNRKHVDRLRGVSIKYCYGDEGVLEWIDRDRLSELTLWEGDKIFLDLLRRDTPFFSLKLRYDGDTLLEAVLDGKPMQI